MLVNGKKFAIAVILTVAACAAPAGVPSAIAIRDARIVTVSGAELPKGTVVLRNGMIEDVGASVPIPSDAWVIDGAGLTVYPGFIDGLSTWGIPSPPPTPPASGGAAQTPQTPGGATQARSGGPEDRPQTHSYERAADLVKPTDSKLEAAHAAGFTSAATFPNQGIFAGLGAMIDLAGERGRDMVVAEPIGQQIVFRTGGFRSGFPGSLMGNISYVRQLFLDLEQYEQAKAIYAAHVNGTPRPEYDHDLEGLAESPRLLLPAVQSQQIDRILAFGAELKKPFAIYGLHEAYERIDELKGANVALLVSLKWPTKPKDQDPSEVPNYRDVVLRERAPSVPGLFVKAGLKFSFYSDGVDNAADLRKAVKKAIDAGLSRQDAVRALTLNTAELYGVADRLGSIDKGKIANLVVTKGEAFEDKTTVEYVFIDGKQFRPSEPEPPKNGKPEETN